MCISFFTLFVSYPLSLYRDISKLAKTSALALVAIIVIIVSVVIEGPQQPSEIRGDPALMFNLINDEVFQAIAVISFGKKKRKKRGDISLIYIFFMYSICLSS